MKSLYFYFEWLVAVKKDFINLFENLIQNVTIEL